MVNETEWIEVGQKQTNTTWAGEKDGDSIWGTVIEFKEVQRKDGSKGNVLVIHNEDTDEGFTIWAKSQLLRLIKDAEIQPGMIVKVEYKGMQPLKTDKTKKFRAYKLFVKASV